jgi:ubiquinone/menaquinone biosynthesis C-methylase UbiE
MATARTLFDYAAEVGLTKHYGGVEATMLMVDLCHIGRESAVLDVGCGVGQTACMLVRRVGCRVVGVDISEAMVRKARERARNMRLEEGIEFRVANAQALPFEDGTFDAVITESVTVFPENKQAAVSEYARVVKPGGYRGSQRGNMGQNAAPA